MADRNQAPWIAVLIGIVALTGGTWISRWWGRPPVIELDNLKYIQLLRTAISAHRDDSVAGVERAVRLRHEAGGMSATEFAHFESVLAAARAGEWDRANRSAYEFEKAQANRQRRKPRETTHHDGH